MTHRAAVALCSLLLAAVIASIALSGTEEKRTVAASRYFKQRHRADDLQRRLTVRVLEVRRLAGYHGSGLEQRFAWLARSFVCVHSHEGSWQDDGAPYRGGLQFDDAFAARYAPASLAGTPNQWTPIQQVAVGILAWTERGFAPWPATSRACGLR